MSLVLTAGLTQSRFINFRKRTIGSTALKNLIKAQDKIVFDYIFTNMSLRNFRDHSCILKV